MLDDLTKEVLQNLYVDWGWAQRDIADLLTCSYVQVGARLKRYGLQMRPSGVLSARRGSP